jgi:hypothetical protein
MTAMTIEEAAIRRLLADRRIEDFEDNPIFRTEIVDRPEAAEILVRLMWTEGGEIASRAREMLSLFGRPALHAVAAALAELGAVWRGELLNILWTIISAEESQDWAALLQGILPTVLPALEDRSLLRFEYQNKPEIEYEYRVCDEAYLFIRVVLDPEYDELAFLRAALEDRDAEIQSLRNRLRPLVG